MAIASPPVTAPLPKPASFGDKQLTVGFYIDWDESSFSSLERNLQSLDWVMPQWAHLVNAKPGESPLANELSDPQAIKALNLIREKRPDLSIIPMVQNLTDETWEKKLLADAVVDEPTRQRLIDALTSFVEQNKFSGICLDFEEPQAETQQESLQALSRSCTNNQISRVVLTAVALRQRRPEV